MVPKNNLFYHFTMIKDEQIPTVPKASTYHCSPSIPDVTVYMDVRFGSKHQNSYYPGGPNPVLTLPSQTHLLKKVVCMHGHCNNNNNIIMIIIYSSIFSYKYYFYNEIFFCLKCVYSKISEHIGIHFI